MSESDLKTAIISALNAAGCCVWRNQAGRARRMKLAPTGSPDIVGFTRWGRFIGLEIKLPKGTTSPQQDEWLSRMRDAGCIAGVARSVSEAIEIVIPNAHARDEDQPGRSVTASEKRHSQSNGENNR